MLSNNSEDIFCNHSIKIDFFPVLIACGSTAAVSAFVCIFAIVLIVIFRMYKSLTNRIILYLLVAALSFSLANMFLILALWQNYWKREHYKWCVAEALINEYSDLVMLFSTLMVTVHLTIMVLFDRCYQNITKLEPFYLFFPWILPLIIAWIPLVHNNYGISGAWCFIRLYNDDCSWNKEGMIEVYATLYGELFLGLILNNIALAVVLVTLCKRSCYNNTSLDYRKALQQTLPLIGFPIIYQMLTWIALANRIYQSATSGKYVKWMFFSHAITAASWGFFAGIFTIVYLITLSEFRNNVMKFVQVFCKCCVKRKKKVINTNVTEHEPLIGVDSEDHFTQYGTTVTDPTSYPFVSESNVEREYDKEIN